MKFSKQELALVANTIRGLAMDMVERAKSGHPGMPMGMADVATVLWLNHLEHCPSQPDWINRDRFVLSAGHGSPLLYSLLHLIGYDISISDLASFRQLGSKTPGHPEYGRTPGVETSTGPLGQGCGNAVGMALAERMLSARFNIPPYEIISHYTYVICSDGDLMEGISHEAFSLAGHLGLSKLIVLYDYNEITIEGPASLAYSDNVRHRFKAYNWNILEIDGHDFDAIENALRRAKREKSRPTIIICHTRIAKGSPNKEGSAESHGAPLGRNEVIATKQNLGLPSDHEFYVPEQVRKIFEIRRKKLERIYQKWEKNFVEYTESYPDKASLWKIHFEDILPGNLDKVLSVFDLTKPIATRSASGEVIQKLAEVIPQLVGGAADLAPSTRTLIKGAKSISKNDFSGRNLHFGVREHAMGAILNGMALHRGLRVFGATFFVFSDYFRPSIRLACLMRLPIIYVFTHDSFYVGEDGPSHQPVEHIAALRCLPNMTVIRPSDATETAEAWIAALKNKNGPTAILLTRHDIPVIDRTKYPSANNLEKGAYVIWQSAEGKPDILLIASGSEVDLALKAGQELSKDKVVRVVSMPSWQLFMKQPKEYRESIISSDKCVKLAIEASSSLGWEKYIGESGKTLCVDNFTESGPYKKLAEHYGFTLSNVIAIVKQMMDKI